LRDFSPSFYLPTRLPCFSRFAVAILTAASLAGCHRILPVAAPDRSLAALSQLPSDTQVVLSVDLDRLRSQPAWKTISSVLARSAKHFLDEVVAGMGIDPARQFHRIWIALPNQPQSDGRFVLLAETDPIDRKRAMAWLTGRARDGLVASLPNSRQVMISKGAWAAAPARAGSAAGNSELRRLCERASDDGAHGFWFAALVPTSARDALKGSGPLADASSMARVFGFLDDAAGLQLQVVGELTNTADPPLLAHRLKMFHNQAKRNPDVLVAGLSPYLESLRVDVHDAQVQIAANFPDAQVGDVLDRIEALALVARTKYSRAP